ncbi:hypothetical protein LCGC14_1908090, partial [marine sediment metagenome]
QRRRLRPRLAENGATADETEEVVAQMKGKRWILGLLAGIGGDEPTIETIIDLLLRQSLAALGQPRPNVQDLERPRTRELMLCRT